MNPRSLYFGAAALTLAACAATAPTGSVRDETCLNSNRLRSFDAFDDRHVFVSEGNDKHYLLTTRGACLDLRYATMLAVADGTRRVCPRGFGKLVYRDGLSGPLQSCYIDQIDPVASKEHARAYIDQRNGVPSPKIEGSWEEIPED